MNKIRLGFKFLISFPKTILFNFRVFPLKIAYKLPVAIAYNVKIKQIYRNCVIIKDTNISLFMIKIGFFGSEAICEQKSIFFMNKKGNGKVIFKGKAKFSSGVTLFNNTGTIIFGENFSANKNCFISCDNKIVFGNDCLLGWNINIRDSDGHKIYPIKNEEKNIRIGNHVWICSNVDILKNNIIGDNCIIGYNSCLTGISSGDNKLICGYPAKVIKDNVNWEI